MNPLRISIKRLVCGHHQSSQGIRTEVSAVHSNLHSSCIFCRYSPHITPILNISIQRSSAYSGSHNHTISAATIIPHVYRRLTSKFIGTCVSGKLWGSVFLSRLSNNHCRQFVCLLMRLPPSTTNYQLWYLTVALSEWMWCIPMFWICRSEWMTDTFTCSGRVMLRDWCILKFRICLSEWLEAMHSYVPNVSFWDLRE